MDVSFLQPVFDATGPFATVTADVTHTTENADTELELRVRGLTDKLSEQGAPEAVVDAVRGRLLEGNEGGVAGTLKGRAVVVAADGRVVLDHALVDAPLRESAEWSPQPQVLQVLRQLPGRVPHVVAVVDRVGADISYFGLSGEAVEEKKVDGETFHMRKVKVGGWAHDHWQNSAENQWETNAARVADEIGSWARRHPPRFVLIAGEVRARNLLADQADDHWKELVVQMDEGGRAAGADREPIDRRVAELVAEHEARECADVLEKIQAAGAHGLAVTGLDSVVEALRKSQVETLVLADDPEHATTLLVGNSPLELGVNQQDMDALGTHGTVVPADSALIAAAVASSADVVVVPLSAAAEHPVAAILRYTDDSTPTNA